MIKKWIEEQMIKSKRTTGFDGGIMLVRLRPQSCLLIFITETVEGNLGSQQGLVYRRRWEGDEVFSATKMASPTISKPFHMLQLVSQNTQGALDSHILIDLFQPVLKKSETFL